MNYFVNWKLSVQDELAAIWLDAPDRDAVSRASRVIDNMRHASRHFGSAHPHLTIHSGDEP